MDTRSLPALYISHGSPMIALEPREAGRFLQRLGPAIETAFGRPRAVLAVSPHTATHRPVLLADVRHEAVHDFGGFPPALYELRYDAPGAPDLAADARALLSNAGFDVPALPSGGLDHGIWTVLRHMWPQADVPVLPLSLAPALKPAEQWRIGRALATLREQGVLVLGTGSLTHNLRHVFQRPVDAPATPETLDFSNWVAGRTAARDWEALLDYRARAPHAREMHPTDEHWLPFYIAAGAGSTDDDVPQRLHASVEHGVLAMDAYAFGAGAADLQAALLSRPAG